MREQAAQGHASFIKSRAANLVANEGEIAGKLAAATAGLHEFGFGDEGEDGGVGGNNNQQQKAMLVDDVNADHGPGSLPYMLDQIKPHPLPPDMRPTASEQNFTAAETFIYNEMMKNQESPWSTAMKEAMNTGPLHPLDKVDALHSFFELTRRDGPWDHKPQIRDMVGIQQGDGLFFQQPGTDRQVYYDIYSNLHYGFIGRAVGIPPSLLEAAPNLQTPFTGVNDAADDIYVKAGISMFDRYGPNMTAAQFHQGLTDVINQMEAAQRSGVDIGQLRHGYK